VVADTMVKDVVGAVDVEKSLKIGSSNKLMLIVSRLNEETKS
jgi:hypothetical protein